MAVVALALRHLPRREGALAVASGLAAFFGIGYLWLFALWIIVPRLEPLFAALPGIYPKAILAQGDPRDALVLHAADAGGARNRASRRPRGAPR